MTALDELIRQRGFVPHESVEQEIFAAWCDLHRLAWFHVPNEGRKTISYHVKMKRQGLKAGVPDNFIITPPPKYPDCRGVAIELKRIKGGQTSPEQRAWLQDLKSCGWIAEVCNGADAAIKFMESLGYGGRG